MARPTKYKAEFCELARNYCLLGATNEKLADFFGVTVSTIGLWIARHSEFSDAVKSGREVADAKVASSLFHRATGYEHPAVKIFLPQGAPKPVYAPYTERYPPETVAAIFWLKNRRPDLWRDVNHQQVSLGLLAPTTEIVTPDQWSAEAEDVSGS